MNSTAHSEVLLSVKNLKVYFELEHYKNQSVRDVFISALTHPLNFLFKTPELLYVINDVSFELERGTRLGILGINGSGKTTLCRCLAGMMKGQQGSLTHNTQSIRAIFDTGNGIMPELTGRENTQLLARLFFPEIINLEDIVNEAIAFSELGHFIDVPFKQYSKGMQARLLLSLISAHNTDLLILDEVFDGADIFFQKKLVERMKSFINRAGATVFVSHTLSQIQDVCNKVMIMDKGKIIFIGKVEEGVKLYLDQAASFSIS